KPRRSAIGHCVERAALRKGHAHENTFANQLLEHRVERQSMEPAFAGKPEVANARDGVRCARVILRIPEERFPQARPLSSDSRSIFDHALGPTQRTCPLAELRKAA